MRIIADIVITGLQVFDTTVDVNQNLAITHSTESPRMTLTLNRWPIVAVLTV